MPQGTLHNSAPAPVPSFGARALQLLLTVVLLALLLYPWTTRLKSPSIVLDDIARIESLRTLALTSRLVAPFNEHLAPSSRRSQRSRGGWPAASSNTLLWP